MEEKPNNDFVQHPGCFAVVVVSLLMPSNQCRPKVFPLCHRFPPDVIVIQSTLLAERK
jgi:hypothetical protein